MKSLLLASALAMGAFSVGCQHDRHNDRHHDNYDSSRRDPKMMSADVCPHCPGVQQAKADGTCPGKCGMKVTKQQG